MIISVEAEQFRTGLGYHLARINSVELIDIIFSGVIINTSFSPIKALNSKSRFYSSVPAKFKLKIVKESLFLAEFRR